MLRDGSSIAAASTVTSAASHSDWEGTPLTRPQVKDVHTHPRFLLHVTNAFRLLYKSVSYAKAVFLKCNPEVMVFGGVFWFVFF